jgi:hypothetical protein
MHVELVFTSLALRTFRVSMLNNLLITHYTVWQTNRVLFFHRMRAPTHPKGRTNCNDSLALLTISPPALLLQAPASLALSAASFKLLQPDNCAPNVAGSAAAAAAGATRACRQEPAGQPQQQTDQGSTQAPQDEQHGMKLVSQKQALSVQGLHNCSGVASAPGWVLYFSRLLI